MQNVNRHQTCRLCGASDDLKRSHVFPEFLYKSCYDDKYRAIRHKIDTKEG